MRDDTAVETQATELLRTLIRNGCVNTGEAVSGQEARSVDALEDFFAGSGLSCERYTSVPGRTSLITRIEGRDRQAPALLLMGHTDVVPANPAGWRRDPFGGDLVDGVVWGRGAIDMLNLTATMAVATRRLATSDARLRGTLIYLAVADEEAGGFLGAGHLAEHEPEAVKCDYVVTESGGVPIPTPSGPKLRVAVGEKGGNWRKLIVHGTPGHGLPGSQIVPWVTTGGTDAKFFRWRGVPSYGFGLHSTRIPHTEYPLMFHGHDERVDTESLRLSAVMWEALCRLPRLRAG